MTAKKIDIMDVRQLIQLKIRGESNRSCSSSLAIHRNTVNYSMAIPSSTSIITTGWARPRPAGSLRTRQATNCWFLGGSTKAIVPDNLKSAVSKASKYEPVLNKTLIKHII